MTINPTLVKNVLKTYDRQLVNGRRLARLSRYISVSTGETADADSRETKRRRLVERVAREIVENLITSDSRNPMVEEIKTDLNQELDTELIFHYPPSGEEMKILKTGKDGPEELTSRQREAVMGKLWEMTLKKVNDTML
ncbi:DVU0524 family FlgM-associated protein [Desulfonatronovibrio hydrogenovorans]|uniref:DVU0524 family FlgM-associated protein n=1 Tax=Desulfonatronovibrio hydrogenovorans TaxID=53245 RepID=UPI00048B9684|nr:DVU0524 family FlgM-associated protein [Desulfonatronovibrio hydrogenovorans]